ncbi:hypothetical protein GUITHDRAFT_79273, partial [Guillardia theta CCMP2712]
MGIVPSKSRNVLYSTTWDNYCVKEIDLTTKIVTTIAGLCGTNQYVDSTGTNARFSNMIGVDLTKNEQYLYVADVGNNKLRRIDTATFPITAVAWIGDGTAGNVQGYGTKARINTPYGVKVSPCGNYVIVSDTGNNMIRKVDIESGYTNTLAGQSLAGTANGVGTLAQFNMPVDVTVDWNETVAYVSDQGNNCIRKIDLLTAALDWTSATPSLVVVAGSGVAGLTDAVGLSAQFYNPTGVAVDWYGASLLVADSMDSTIRRIDLMTSEVTTLAGNGNAGFIDNLYANDAEFTVPFGVALSRDGKYVFVSDQNRNNIRKM